MKKLLLVSILTAGVNLYAQAGESEPWDCQTQCLLPKTCTAERVNKCRDNKCQIGFWCTKTGAEPGKSPLRPQTPTRPVNPAPMPVLPNVPPSQESVSAGETTPRAGVQREPSQKILQKKDSKVLATSDTYTVEEMNRFIKGLLADNHTEVISGCNVAVSDIKKGLMMIESEKTPEANVVKKIGDDAMSDLGKMMKDAENAIENYKLTQKIPVDKLRKEYPDVLTKSRNALRDCKKMALDVFKPSLDAYFAKLNAPKNEPEKKPKAFERLKGRIPFSAKNN